MTRTMQEVEMSSFEQRIQRLEVAKTYLRPLTDPERVVRIAALKEGTPAHAAVWAIVLRDGGSKGAIVKR